MPNLSPCPACNRHLRNTEPVCPFCQAEVPSSAPLTRAAQSIAKAAILAGSLSAAAACSGGDGDSKVDASQQASVDAQAGTPDASPGQTDAAAGQADAAPLADAAVIKPDGMPPLPYGAPPARKRFV